ncbi:cellulose biosynthesis protein BcsN [Acuticoccus sp. I52.16.1]|uniref:cellulose biosynthesis protein BcsN n=1 Tax=Acuticoccus sp. I52.16.1 TaxID=2928472 RepID=UPI001FD328E7|nr:cellulose biosynthesis protein BcsN [Acuticoccus sp. I52.16.1]UOM35989.1 cellulose biosynthesis protein BcsN [Acuticoccus sp. I52.16.1]
MTSRKMHQAIAVLAAALVGGCSYNPTGGVVRSASLNRQIDISEAFITPPPGGPAVIAVLENRYVNGLAQDILLEDDSGVAGQNVIIVRAYGPMGAEAGRETLSTDIIDLHDIRKEMQSQFPGVHMEVSGLYAQNRYGPFSYATGRARTGANCVYAWQRIAAEARVFSAQRGAITWRMRVCDRGTDTRTLLLLAYGLTINGYFLSQRWNPYGDPPEPDPRIGRPGETILPQVAVDPTVVAPTSFGPRRETTIARPRRRAVTVTAVEPAIAQPTVLNQPIEGAAIVPRPENTDLSEPRVESSNLPATGLSTRGGSVVVPSAGGRAGLSNTPTSRVRVIRPTN